MPSSCLCRVSLGDAEDLLINASQPRRGMLEFKRSLQQNLHSIGWDVKRYHAWNDDEQRLVKFCSDRQIGVLLDVGANVGQFARRMIAAGFAGRIVSFEPLSAARRALDAVAQRFPDWTVAERCALGGEPGVAEINVAADSYSSSLLPVLPRHLAAAPYAARVGGETVPVKTLDEIIDRDFVNDERLALKMDVQGYEAEVLRGAARTLHRIDLIHTEMSLRPLYAGGRLYTDLCSELAARGFRCVGITPAFVDPISYEVLQVDGTFVRDR